MATSKSTRLFTDLDLDFTAHPLNGDVSIKTNEDAVKRSIRNIVLYNKYEKPFTPRFGSSIKEMLFENIKKSTGLGIETRIKDMLRQYEPRCHVISVKAEPDIHNSQYVVSIEFNLQNVLNPITTVIYLQRIR